MQAKNRFQGKAFIAGAAGGEPFVLAEKNPWLAEISQERLRDPRRFWRKLKRFPEVKGAVAAILPYAVSSDFIWLTGLLGW